MVFHQSYVTQRHFFICIYQLFCHCVFIHANVHLKSVSFLYDRYLYCFCLLADSHETINRSISLTLTTDFSKLWKNCYRFTRTSLHTAQNYVAYRCQQSLSRCITCQDDCIQQSHAAKENVYYCMVARFLKP